MHYTWFVLVFTNWGPSFVVIKSLSRMLSIQLNLYWAWSVRLLQSLHFISNWEMHSVSSCMDLKSAALLHIKKKYVRKGFYTLSSGLMGRADGRRSHYSAGFVGDVIQSVRADGSFVVKWEWSVALLQAGCSLGLQLEFSRTCPSGLCGGQMNRRLYYCPARRAAGRVMQGGRE